MREKKRYLVIQLLVILVFVENIFLEAKELGIYLLFSTSDKSLFVVTE